MYVPEVNNNEWQVITNHTMKPDQIPIIVAINSGSSSLKLSLFSCVHSLQQIFTAKITGIGKSNCLLSVTGADKEEVFVHSANLNSDEEAAELIVEWLQHQHRQYIIIGIGHRVVHGGLQFREPELIDSSFLTELKEMESLAPLHLPSSIAIMKVFRRSFPGITQIACFDTAFHSQMPFEAKHYAIPRSLWTEGIVRYGFHGISCEYILQELQTYDPLVSKKKIIIAHLGSGCSITAVKDGHSIDNTMGFSPAGGLVMNTRAGDIDPGVLIYLLQEKKMDAEELMTLFNKESGLKAIAGPNYTMEKLLQEERSDARAGQAVNVFCYHVKKQIGALAAALGGVDIIVFTGGIGEHAAPVRKRICDGLNWMGVQLNDELNEQHERIITGDSSTVQVQVIAANEEIVIARQVKKCLLQYH
jgi:acetate kinase